MQEERGERRDGWGNGLGGGWGGDREGVRAGRKEVNGVGRRPS